MLFLLCPSQAGGAVTEKDDQRDRREQTPAAADVTMVLAVLAGRFDKDLPRLLRAGAQGGRPAVRIPSAFGTP